MNVRTLMENSKLLKNLYANKIMWSEANVALGSLAVQHLVVRRTWLLVRGYIKLLVLNLIVDYTLLRRFVNNGGPQKRFAGLHELLLLTI